MAKYTKENLLNRIVMKISLYNPDYLTKWMPRLKAFDLVQLVAWAIDNDVVDAASFYLQEGFYEY